MKNEILRNLESVRARVDCAVRASGRFPESVRVMAVSKTQPEESLRAALSAGQRLFGENRVQEACARWPTLRTEYPDVSLHLIGPLQTNKVRSALALFDCIQTLDRPELARTLAGEMARTGRRIPFLIQVNTAQESQKHGIRPADFPDFLRLCQDTYGLDIAGLMTIPPLNVPPVPCFSQLAGMAKAYGLPELSMGMSGDFESAIACGATYVRIGTALFGGRVSV
ncbi:MAG: YggS family pyridoxal phosphate-dependent enzyme [Rhodospirillales bacterium]|nr:YggS family pyridoxal phosphate-dependent enzyme [Rhodospirillales bacterium]